MFIAVLLVASLAGGVWFWHGNLAGTPQPADDDQIPTRLWSELTTTDSSVESPYAQAEVVGTIIDRKLNEISGLAASRRSDDLYWVHNDSGDRPRLFAITPGGKVRGEFRVVGAVNEDWEDIASGPGRDGEPALYIGDIGDNALRRNFIVVYRVHEPDLSKPNPAADTEPAEPFQFVYPDGRHDAEALIVDPENGRIYIITKTRSDRCAVYRSPFPLRPGAPMTLERVEGVGAARLSELRYVTGADAAPDGGRIIVRTYFSAFELTRAPGRSFESMFDTTPVQVSLPIEPQGEAITYTRDGAALLTTSEKIPARIHRLEQKR